jgi:hypothetical protein
MAFDWREYLTLAEAIHREAGATLPEEAANRSAVSRAYYAAFCAARNWAATHQNFQAANNPNDHPLLRNHFKGRRGWLEVASTLDELRQWRNQCDYTDEIPGDIPALAQMALQGSQKILDRLRT